MRRVLDWIGWQGRLRRRSFLWKGIVATLVFIVLFVFLQRAVNYASTLILYPPFFAVAFSLCLRRLHDRARSAWPLLWLLVPVLGPIYVACALLFMRGTDGDNQYGNDPRTAGRDYLQVRIHAQP